MKINMSNYSKYSIFSGLNGVVTLFTTGALFQNFLIEKGIGESAAGTVVSVTYFTQLISMLCGIFIIDRIKNVLGAFSLTLAVSVIPFAVMLGYCRDGGSGFYGVILAVMTVFNISRGLYTVLSYKVPYHIFDMQRYGKVVAISGFVLYSLNIVLSLTMIRLLKSLDYFFVMRIMFVICILSAIGSAWIMLKMKKTDVNIQPLTEKNVSIRLTDKDCAVFIIPNFIRGVTNGIIDCVALFAVADLGINSSGDRTLIATLCAAAAVAANAIFIFTSKPRRVRYICLIGAALCMMFPMMLAGRSYTVFLCVYFAVYVGRILCDNSVPVLVTQFVPYEKIGAYSSVRMLITTAGSAAGSGLIGAYLGKIPSFLFLAFAGVCLLICAAVYFIYVKKNTLNKNATRRISCQTN